MTEFNFGDRVLIRGNKKYCTHGLDGQIGRIVSTRPDNEFYVVEAGQHKLKYFVPYTDLTLVNDNAR